jgi:hypothetical protein
MCFELTIFIDNVEEIGDNRKSAYAWRAHRRAQEEEMR